MAEADRTEPAADEAAWRRLAEQAIGAGFESLRSRSADGLSIEPLYRRGTDDPCQPWRPDTAWSVAQRVDHPEPADANTQVLLDLEGGTDALVLVTASSPFNRRFGLAPTLRDLDLALDRVELDFIGMRMDAGPGTRATLDALTALAAQRRLTSAALAVDVGFDPIGWQARLGEPVEDDPRPLLDLYAAAGLAGTVFLADGRPWHEAGAGEAQELAAILATAVAYLRRQEALGLGLDAARRAIGLLLAADADVFLGLAKFRAMRRLWARVEAACGLDPVPVHLDAETSWRMMARRDPWMNVMRTTAATVAAGLGGADRITVLPFTLPIGLPDAAARRLARNIQRVLLDEARLAAVEDPAAGAGSFEAFTEALCVEAWRLFQEIEAEGGIERSIVDGRLAARVAATARTRAHDIAHLTRGIVGTSRFASLDAPEVAVLGVAPQLMPNLGENALPVLRDAAPFEALRDRADALLTAPRVFLATLGSPADFGPRATYAVNFFAAGGIVAEGGMDVRDLAGLAAAFKARGATVACLCGSDEAYAGEGGAVVEVLSAAGARLLFAVGEMRIAGIDASLHDGADAVCILENILHDWQG